jgi:hypothetical protein
MRNPRNDYDYDGDYDENEEEFEEYDDREYYDEDDEDIDFKEEWEDKFTHIQENMWIKNTNPRFEYDELIKHNFKNNMLVIFKISETSISYEHWSHRNNASVNTYIANNSFSGATKIKGGIDNSKNIVDNIINHFFDNKKVNDDKINLYSSKIIAQQNKNFDIKTNNRQLETAQKTGYVQGVCESVLAFNNDENRKIMTEVTMTFLSKKLLSEMNVTKDMAQKFASPETYKALEQSVFAPKQEQQLEQTQTRGRGI